MQWASVFQRLACTNLGSACRGMASRSRWLTISVSTSKHFFLTTKFTLSEHFRAWHERRKRKSCGARTPQPGRESPTFSARARIHELWQPSGAVVTGAADKCEEDNASCSYAKRTSCALQHLLSKIEKRCFAMPYVAIQRSAVHLLCFSMLRVAIAHRA